MAKHCVLVKILAPVITQDHAAEGSFFLAATEGIAKYLDTGLTSLVQASAILLVVVGVSEDVIGCGLADGESVVDGIVRRVGERHIECNSKWVWSFRLRIDTRSRRERWRLFR